MAYLSSDSSRSPLSLALHRVGLAAMITVLVSIFGHPAHKATLLRHFLPAIAQAQVPATSSATIVSAGLPASSPQWSTLEQEIMAEHNRIRQNPQSYIPLLTDYLATMNAQGEIPNGCGQNCNLVTQEGRSAVEEAIDFLRNQPPVGALDPSAEIARVAKAHAQEQQGGAIGHVSANGQRAAERLRQAGIQATTVGESIDYGSTTAQSVVMSLLIDDGVADRGHRISLFSPEWTVLGVGCGPHARIRTVCVVDYAKVSRQLTVRNDGTVDLRSLQVAGVDILRSNHGPVD